MKRYINTSYGGWNKFYGLPDVEFTVPNDTDDPTIYFDGKYYNYYDIEDALWDYYKEDCEENGVIPDETDFEHFVKDNSDLVYELLDTANPKSSRGRGVYRDGEFYGSANSARRMSGRKITASAWVAPNGKKYGKQSRRFPNGYLFTRKELKDMVDLGIAEQLTNSADLHAMNYDVIGFSWNDTNGHKSGILVEDRDTGNLYVGNTGVAQTAKW